MNYTVNVDLIKNYIIKNRLSVKEFCKQCNISTPTYYKLLKDDRGDVRIETLYRISRVLNIPMSKLII